MQRAILVVDPDADRRARLRLILAKNDSRVVGEVDGPEEAMRVAVMAAPDVAVIAADMGNGGGTPLAGRLATEHGIPTVLLGSTASAADILRTAHSGVMGFLVDPVDERALWAALEVAVLRFQEFLALRREAEGLRRSLEARKVIERAKGLLMQMDGIPEQEAFARLRQKSMDTQRPMEEIARAVILAAEVSGRAR